MIKRFLSLSVLLAMLWGCTQVNEDTSATEEKTASYKVEHYQQNANDDGYTLVEADSENKNGKTGENTSVQAKTYEGFTAKTVEQVKITADGKAVVKIYYDRKKNNKISITNFSARVLNSGVITLEWVNQDEIKEIILVISKLGEHLETVSLSSDMSS